MKNTYNTIRALEIPLVFTKHWDITSTYSIFEIMLPDGRYIMFEWNNDHKLVEKTEWKYRKIQL